MNQSLKLHPDSRCSAATGIDVQITRPRPGTLVMRYFVKGKTSDLCLPSIAASSRSDELWQHTCFEVFATTSSNDAYYEFNFAPSTQWAAYQFRGYRSGMRALSEIDAPSFEVQQDAEGFELQASLDLGQLPGLPTDATWQLGISTVIEETSGDKSWWALAHPPGKADFHHSDCFTYNLASTSDIAETS